MSRRDGWAEEDALEAAFAADPDPSSEPPSRVSSAPFAVDETRALGFVRNCAIGALALVVVLLGASVYAQNAVRTASSASEWVFFVSQFVFIAAPGLFVLGIAALVFVGYRRRLAPPRPEERSPR